MTTKRNSKGQRIVRMTPELMEDLLVHNDILVKTDLPHNARLVSLWVDEENWDYKLKFESSEWEEMVEGEFIPIIEPEVEIVSVEDSDENAVDSRDFSDNV